MEISVTQESNEFIQWVRINRVTVTLMTWVALVRAYLNFRWFTDTFSYWCNFVKNNVTLTFIWCICNDVMFQCLWRHSCQFKGQKFCIIFLTCTCAPPLWKRFRHPRWCPCITLIRKPVQLKSEPTVIFVSICLKRFDTEVNSRYFGVTNKTLLNVRTEKNIFMKDCTSSRCIEIFILNEKMYSRSMYLNPFYAWYTLQRFFIRS